MLRAVNVTDAPEEALVAQYERSRFLDQLHVTAMALSAMTARRTGAEAFRVYRVVAARRQPARL